jgi:hypothetical protein
MSTLDTVRFDLKPAAWTGKLPPGWKDIRGTRSELHGTEKTDTGYRMLQHQTTGLRVGGSPSDALWLETSMPRLVHPSNGILLRPGQVPLAVERCRELLDAAAPASSLEEMTRADLALHFREHPDNVIQALRGLKHPKVRRAAREFFGTGLEWPGANVHARFYDKRMEQDRRPGDVMRLEFQVRGRKHLPAIWNGRDFDMATAHRSYRRLALGFQPRPLTRPADLAGFLAWLDRSNVLVRDERPAEVFLSMKSSVRYRQHLRAQMRRAIVPEFVLDFTRLIPETGSPEWIDCPPDSGPGREAA